MNEDEKKRREYENGFIEGIALSIAVLGLLTLGVTILSLFGISIGVEFLMFRLFLALLFFAGIGVQAIFIDRMGR